MNSNSRDRLLRDGTCAALESAARRSARTLESAIERLTPRQIELLPAEFLKQLRQEAASRAGYMVGDPHPTFEVNP